jgi:UDP-N-acetylglucosamine transferase subunit ALG13
MQTSYTDYKPVYYQNTPFLDYQEMEDRVKTARIVITHGGTGTVMQVLRHGKIPIVVPRQKIYKEVVDDHQVLFSKRLAEIGKVIIALDVNELGYIISNYDDIVEDLIPELYTSNNLDKFVAEFEKITKLLLNK